MLKSALKLLELNPSQQQFILTRINQFRQQNTKSKLMRKNSIEKRASRIDSKKKPPLPLSNQDNKLKLNQSVKKISIEKSKISLKIQSVSEPFKQLHLKSLIIKNAEETEKIINFFPKNSIKSFTLVFKASDHKFSLKQFFSLHGNTENLMFICQTNKDKVIGAFSPISHQFTAKNGVNDKYGQKVKDQFKQSFIFSLINNDKFEMKTEDNAIYRWRDKKYLIFGEWEFALCEDSNVNKNCRTDNINLNYFNSKYKNSKESWIKLNGNEDPWFSTKEWEAWKVEFQNQKI